MSISDDDLKHPNVRKFLDLISKAEGAEYNTVVGDKYALKNYNQHPAFVGLKTKSGSSTAAGRYQITNTTYSKVAPRLGIKDFTPESQDRIAVYLIKDKGVLEDVKKGDYRRAINALGGVWASFPSSTEPQPKRSWDWVNKQLGSPMEETKVSEQAPAAPSTAKLLAAYKKAQEDGNEKVMKEFSGILKPKLLSSYDKAVAAGDTTAAEELLSTYRSTRGKFDREATESDPLWIRNAKTLYAETEGKAFSGSDKDAAKWLKNYMSGFSNNTVLMANRALSAIPNMSDEGKKAFAATLDDYDSLPTFSMEGFLQGAKFQAADPANYASIGTVGAAMLGKEATKRLALMQVRDMLRKTTASSAARAGARGAAVGAVDGSILAGGQDALTQQAKVSAGAQDSIDGGQVAGRAALGGAGGAVLGGGIGAIANKLANRTVPGRIGRVFDNNPRAQEDAEIIQDAASLLDQKNAGVPSWSKGSKVNLNAQDMGNYAKGLVSDIKVELGRAGFKDEYIDDLLRNPSKIATLDPVVRQRIEKAAGGPEALAQVAKSLRVGQLTPAEQAVGGAAGLGRDMINAGVADIALSTAVGFPAPIATGIRASLAKRAGGAKYRWENAMDMVDPTNVKAAQEFAQEAGPSEAAQGVLRLRDRADKMAADEAAVKAANEEKASTAADELRKANIAGARIARVPVGSGAFQALRQYTGLTDDQIVEGLRILSNHPDLQKNVDMIRQGGNTQDGVLYPIQEALVGMRKRGVFDSGHQPQTPLGQATAAIGNSSGPQNPISLAVSQMGLDDVNSMLQRTTDTKGEAITNPRGYLTTQLMRYADMYSRSEPIPEWAADTLQKLGALPVPK